jgi:outer membrane protein assembly complex protein YaeT
MKKTSLFCLWLFALPGALWARTVEAPPPPAAILQHVTFQGNKAIGTDYFMKRITLKPGAPLKRDQLKFSVGIVESTYRDKGYYDVHVSTTVTYGENNATADLGFTIHEGDVYHVGTIQIQGNHAISHDIVLKNLGVHPGDLFSQSKIFDGSRQLYMTGYFDAIDFKYSTTTAHTVDIAITVKERATRFAKGGVGYGTQTKERVTLGYEDVNFLGNARKLDTSVTYSGFLTTPSHYETTIVQAGLTQPYIFGTKYEAQTNVSREWDKREPYDSIQSAWKSSLGRRFSQTITANIRYRYQGTRVTRVSPDADTPGFTNISAVGPTFTYDNTNDPFLPSIGWRINGTYEEGMRIFVGDVRFHKLESHVGRFDSVPWGWTLFEGLQAGEILPDSTSGHDIIPIYERYFLGGANTVRGYSERELGPRDATGVPLGGNAFLVGNFEMRHRLYKMLFGVLFLDGGQLYPTDPGAVWPHARMTALNDFLYGTGAGLRLHSPIGAIRLELGYKLNPRGGTSFFDRTAIHFSIGEVF